MPSNQATGNTEEERTVLRFFELWEKRDTDGILTYFNDDSVYIDMPLPPRNGIAEITAYIDKIFSAFDFKIETFNIGSNGPIVFTERYDYINTVGDDKVYALPIVGVMKIENGKIVEWRDYFDVLSTEEGLGLRLRPED